MIIENDGIEGCIASGAVAASAALADAGIEMLGLVMSCAAVCISFQVFLQTLIATVVDNRERNLA